MENPTFLPKVSEVQNSRAFYLRLPKGAEKNGELIRCAFQRLLDVHPEVLTQDIQSPEEVFKKLALPLVEVSTAPKKGKWAAAAERLKKNRMSPEAGRIMNEAIKDFRETFAIGDSFDEKET